MVVHSGQTSRASKAGLHVRQRQSLGTDKQRKQSWFTRTSKAITRDGQAEQAKPVYTYVKGNHSGQRSRASKAGLHVRQRQSLGTEKQSKQSRFTRTSKAITRGTDKHTKQSRFTVRHRQLLQFITATRKLLISTFFNSTEAWMTR